MTLDQVLGAIASVRPGSFAIIGAVARNAWAPPRATTDLDLAVAADAGVVEELSATLTALGYERVREQRVEPHDELPDIIIFRSNEPGLRQVDLLVAKTSFEQQAVTRSERIVLADHELSVVTPEDLVVYKLIAHRPRDVEDVRAILRTQSRTARSIDWSHIERWCAYWHIADRLARVRDEVSRGP